MNGEKNKYTRGMKGIKRKPVDANMNKTITSLFIYNEA